MRYKVNEEFMSVQGEGVLTGTPSTFIRLQGCSVGCPWCDSGPLADEIEGKRRTNGKTANTWGPGGEWMTTDEILAQVFTTHVIITGGEPTIWNLDPIIGACKDLGMTTQLETSGQNALKGNLEPDWVTWSPKSRLSFDAPISLKRLVNEVKFVVDTELKRSDVQKLVDDMFYEHYGRPQPIIVMMPEGCPPNQEAIQKALGFVNSIDIDYHNFLVRFGWRLQYTLGMR